MFTHAETSDFVGSVRCMAPGEAMFTGVAVEIDAENQIFTTLPVVPVPERMSQGIDAMRASLSSVAVGLAGFGVWLMYSQG